MKPGEFVLVILAVSLYGFLAGFLIGVSCCQSSKLSESGEDGDGEEDDEKDEIDFGVEDHWDEPEARK